MVDIAPKLNYAFLCDYAFLGTGGKLNVIGIFKNINIKTLPTQHPLMFIVASIAVPGKGNYKVNVKFVRRRDGVEIIPALNFDLSVISNEESDVGELGIIGQIANLKFEEEGMYDVAIVVNEKSIESLTLKVSQIQKNGEKKNN